MDVLKLGKVACCEGIDGAWYDGIGTGEAGRCEGVYWNSPGLCAGAWYDGAWAVGVIAGARWTGVGLWCTGGAACAMGANTPS